VSILSRKLTRKEIIEQIKSVHGNELSLVGDYDGLQVKTEFKCNKGLGHPNWYSKPCNVIHRGSGCPMCSNKRVHDNQKKPLSIIKKEISAKYNNDISIVKYTGSRSKSIFHCNKGLNHPDWECAYYTLNGCPECNKMNYYVKREPIIKNMIYKQSNSTISMVGKFKGNNVRTTFRCNKGLGHPDWEATPGKILRGGICHKCHSFGRRPADDYYEEFLENHKDGNVSLVAPYIDNYHPVELKCNIHKNHPNWKVRPYDGLHKNKYCPICWCSIQSKMQRKPDSYYIKSALPYIVGKGAILGIIRVRGLNGAGKEHTKLKIVCSKCGNVWYPSLNNLKRGNWCHNCVSSVSERLIAGILEVNHIEYEREYSVIVDGNVNRLDFLVPKTPKGAFVIESDGNQHHKKSCKLYWDRYPVKDAQKDKWCKDNDYTMLRINSDKYTLPELINIIQDSMGYYNLVSPSITGCPISKSVFEIPCYYLNNSAEKTSEKYHITTTTVKNKFKRVYGMSKRDYIKEMKSDCNK